MFWGPSGRIDMVFDGLFGPGGGNGRNQFRQSEIIQNNCGPVSRDIFQQNPGESERILQNLGKKTCKKIGDAPPWRPQPWQNESLQMPNKRDPDKKQLRAWMYSSDFEFIKRKAKQMNMNVSELVIKLANQLKEDNKNNKKWAKWELTPL